MRSFMKMAGIRTHVVKILCKIITNECKKLTSRSSSLKYVSAQNLKDFKWEMMEKEIVTVAPTLFAMLKSALIVSSSRPPDTRKVCMTAALLLKGRNKNASVIQSMISVLLYSGHCSKMVSVCMQFSMVITAYWFLSGSTNWGCVLVTSKQHASYVS